MTDHTTVSLSKTLVSDQRVKDYMNKMGIDSVSGLVRHLIRRVIFQDEQNTTRKILEKVLEKKNVTPTEYKQIVQEITEEEKNN